MGISLDAAAPELLASEPGAKFDEGLQVIRRFRETGRQAMSEYAACLCPLLEKLGWQGRSVHVAEAIPHFIDDIDLRTFREVLANLNLRTFPVRARQDRINPGLLPCLFVPDRGSVRVLLSVDEDGFEIYDGFTKSVRRSEGKGVAGTAYVVRPVEDREAATGQKPAFVSELPFRFGWLIAQVLFVTLMVNLLAVCAPIFMMSVYDIVIPSGSTAQLMFLVAGVGAGLALECGFRWLRTRILAHAAGRIDYIIGSSSFRQVLFLPIGMTENEPLGAQISHLQEFESVREFFAGSLAETLLDLPFVLIFLAAIAAVGGWLVLIPTIGAAVLVLATLLISPLVKRIYVRSASGRTRQQRFLIEALSGMRAIKFAGAEDVWMGRFRDMSAESAFGDLRVAMVNNFVQTLGRAILLATGIAMIGFGAQMAMDGTISIGALVATMALGWRVLSPFQSSLMLLNRAAQIRSSLTRINHLMRLPAERVPGRIPPRLTYRGRIAFERVIFRHTPEATPAVAGVSFGVEPGEVLAITGPNGAGKSTIVNLAAGLYRPQMGAVMVDGVDIRQMDAIDIRQNIGLVPQVSELLYGTVAQNLRVSVPTATDAELEEATRSAAVHDAIMALPQGYETRLTEAVVSELPEGFKQKLSIARALLRKPPILIFDEPGQMLDERGDRAFLASVQKLRGRTTVIIVTHRPSHMRVADRLIVLEAGRIRFDGLPEEGLKQMEGQLP